MTEVNTLFRKRIGIPYDEKITFDMLEEILEKTAKAIPFDNVDIIENNIADVTKENIIHKILRKHEGGLCYQLNSLLHFFLAENGFEVHMVRGIVYNQVTRDWYKFGRTHAVNLLIHEGKKYLVDTGYGINISLQPVPLDGTSVVSSNGEFRIKRVDTEQGDCIFEMKVNNRDSEWKTGFIFHSERLVSDLSEFNDLQNIIVEEPESPFNKNLLLAQLTDTGHMTLTDTSFTRFVNGETVKEKIDGAMFKKLAQKHFKWGSMLTELSHLE